MRISRMTGNNNLSECRHFVIEVRGSSMDIYKIIARERTLALKRLYCLWLECCGHIDVRCMLEKKSHYWCIKDMIEHDNSLISI